MSAGDKPTDVEWGLKKSDHDAGEEPVDLRHVTVGWLVCISGSEIGASHRIVPGGNWIGRNPENDIRIEASTVSGDRHVKLAYDPAAQDFVVMLGPTTDKLAYLNDEALWHAAMPLKHDDELRIGGNKYVFVEFQRHADWFSEGGSTAPPASEGTPKRGTFQRS